MKYLTGLAIAFLLTPTFALAAPSSCECVRFLRDEAGVNIKGNANTLYPNAPIMNIDVGHVLLTKYGSVHHAALVVGFEWEDGRQTPTSIVVLEANYERCKVGVRKIVWESKEIKGVYVPSVVQ